MVTREVHRQLICTAGPFHFSHIADYIYDFCPLPDPDVGLSILVCDVEHTSFHFDLFTDDKYIFNTSLNTLYFYCRHMNAVRAH